MEINISQISVNPNQPRKTFKRESLVELGQTIKNHGLVQPIVVEEFEGGYLLVDGERRLRASELAGLTTIRADVRERSNHGGRELLLSALIANVQREDMNPIDEAMAYDELRTKHDMKPMDIAHKVGKPSKRIYDLLELLKLEKPIQELIRDGKLSHDNRQAKALLKIADPALRIELAERAAKTNLKIRTVIAAAEKLENIQSSKPLGMPREKSPALVLARRQKGEEEVKPPKWDSLKQLGKLPAWPLVVLSAKATCAECELRSMASPATCGRCPSVSMLETMIKKCSEVK